MPASMQAATDLPALGLRRFVLLFAALFAAAAAPVLICDTLPLFDYPNHLARMHILADLARSPDLQRFYAIVWRPVPDLAMDAITPTLAHVMPLVWAGKAFVLLTLFLLVGGVAALHRTLFGVWSAWPCLAFLLLYSRILLWGFLNYLFGLGLGLCATALWIALRHQSPALRLAVGALAALALFFAHLLAFGLYGVMVMGYEAGQLLRRRSAPGGAAREGATPFLRGGAGDVCGSARRRDGGVARQRPTLRQPASGARWHARGQPRRRRLPTRGAQFRGRAAGAFPHARHHSARRFRADALRLPDAAAGGAAPGLSRARRPSRARAPVGRGRRCRAAARRRRAGRSARLRLCRLGRPPSLRAPDPARARARVRRAAFRPLPGRARRRAP